MNKGFTLIELLAAVTILGILALIGTLSISTIIKNNKQKSYDIQMSAFIDNVKVWALDHPEVLPEDNKTYKVSYGQLMTDGYADKDVKNPITGEVFSSELYFCINKINGQYIYSEC